MTTFNLKFNGHDLQNLIALKLKVGPLKIAIKHKRMMKMKDFHYFAVILLIINHCIGSNNGIQLQRKPAYSEEYNIGKILIQCKSIAQTTRLLLQCVNHLEGENHVDHTGVQKNYSGGVVAYSSNVTDESSKVQIQQIIIYFENTQVLCV